MADDAEILLSLGRLEKGMEDIKEDVSRLATVVVDGNHVPPLTTRVDRLEQSAQQKSNVVKRNWMVFTGIISALATAITALALAWSASSPNIPTP